MFLIALTVLRREREGGHREDEDIKDEEIDRGTVH
jgi:hypothetical protein